jgi:hypothetical protein
MDFDQEIAEISASLDQLQAHLATSLPTTANPLLRDTMDAMTAQLTEGRAKFAEAFKTAMAQADEKMAQVNEQTASLADRIRAADEKLAAPPAVTVPEIPAKPKFAVDPGLGQKLRQELLDRYGGHQPEAEQRAWEAGREVWDDWSDWSKN